MRGLIACVLLLVTSSLRAEVYELPPEGFDVIGALSTVTARYEDTLVDIARRHGDCLIVSAQVRPEHEKGRTHSCAEQHRGAQNVQEFYPEVAVHASDSSSAVHSMSRSLTSVSKSASVIIPRHGIDPRSSI